MPSTSELQRANSQAAPRCGTVGRPCHNGWGSLERQAPELLLLPAALLPFAGIEHAHSTLLVEFHAADFTTEIRIHFPVVATFFAARDRFGTRPGMVLCAVVTQRTAFEPNSSDAAS